MIELLVVVLLIALLSASIGVVSRQNQEIRSRRLPTKSAKALHLAANLRQRLFELFSECCERDLFRAGA